MPESKLNCENFETTIDMGKGYFTQNNLLSMGWTMPLIKQLLPPPYRGRNPVFVTQRKMKLFPKAMVLRKMETPAFKNGAKFKV